MPNPNAFEKRLRSADPPVVARIEKDKIILDMRTIADDEIALVRAANASEAVNPKSAPIDKLIALLS